MIVIENLHEAGQEQFVQTSASEKIFMYLVEITLFDVNFCRMLFECLGQCWRFLRYLGDILIISHKCWELPVANASL